MICFVPCRDFLAGTAPRCNRVQDLNDPARATDTSAIRNSAADISAYLTAAETELDIDGSGDVTALTDGLLLIRYLFGFSGDSLISGAVGTNATRTTSSEIEEYIKARVPSS